MGHCTAPRSVQYLHLAFKFSMDSCTLPKLGGSFGIGK
jgi:hypothetical protein